MAIMKGAIIVIDMQRAYYSGAVKDSMDRAAGYINAAVELFREKGLPVIWTQGVDPEDGAAPGLDGFELIPPLRPEAGDKFIRDKNYNNAFNKTDLLDFLRGQGVDTLIVSGFSAEYCVLSTCRGAKDHDLVSVLLRSGLASGSPECIPFVERINDLISLGALEKMLG